MHGQRRTTAGCGRLPLYAALLFGILAVTADHGRGMGPLAVCLACPAVRGARPLALPGLGRLLVLRI